MEWEAKIGQDREEEQRLKVANAYVPESTGLDAGEFDFPFRLHFLGNGFCETFNRPLGKPKHYQRYISRGAYSYC